MRANLIQMSSLLILGILASSHLTACNNGSSGINTQASINSSSAGELFPASLNTTALAANNCFKISAATTSQNTAWYVGGAFSLSNSCSVPQTVNGIQINLLAANSSLVSSAFQSHGATGLTFPAPLYWAATTLTAANSAAVNGKTGLILTVSTNASGVLNPGATAIFSYGYIAGGVATGSLSFTLANLTPLPTPTPTSIPSSVPQPTPSSNSGSECYGIANWNLTTIYPLAGAVVVYNAVKYRNNWWTQGDNPVNHNGGLGSGQPWTMVGPCSILVAVESANPENVPPVTPLVTTGQLVAYYETWLAMATWTPETYSLAKIPAYINTIVIAFAKPNAIYTKGNFSGTGLDFTPGFSVVAAAIKLAQAKGQKVLLSVGGATYQNFAGLNIPALIGIVKDLGMDGIDLDFEPAGGNCANLNTNQLVCPSDNQLINIITQLRTGLDSIRPGLTLSAAVWSIGAYGSANYPTTKYGPVGANSGIWINPLKQVGNKLDELFLMSYDAGVYTPTGTVCVGSIACYDPAAALLAYKALYKGPIYQGIEVPPEAWGGNLLTPTKALAVANSAATNGAAGMMIWALEVQGYGYTANSFLQPLCLLYHPSAQNLCNQLVPLN